MSDYNGYDDTDEDDDDKKLPLASAGHDQSWTPPPSAALANPVLPADIQSFQTPAAASTNTVPAAPPASTNRPTAQPADDPSPSPSQPQAAPADAARMPQTSPSSTTNAAPAPQVQPAATPASDTAPAAPDDPFAANAALYRQFNQSRAQQAAQPAPQPAQDDSTSGDSAPADAGPVDPFTANAQLYKQFNAGQAAELKYHVSQGGATEVLPSGATVIKRDDDGNALFKPAIIAPFMRADDGTAYRVSRNEQNNQSYFPLADGVEGADYHVDESGQKYVDVSGADGSSRREIIGQDPLAPQITDLRSQLTQHVNSAAQANIQIAQATDGVQGSSNPLGAYNLGDLEDRAKSLTKDIMPLKQQLDDLSSYADDSSSDDITQKQQIQQQIGFKQNILDQVQGELDNRQSIIADAKQRRDATAQQRLDSGTQLAVLQRVKQMGGLNSVQGDLNTIATGGAVVDPNATADASQSRWKALVSMGLATQQPNDDGTPGTMLKVTPRGVGMLDSDTQADIKSNPDKYMVSSTDMPVPPHVARAVQKLAGMADTSVPDDPTKAPPGLASAADSSGAGGTSTASPGLSGATAAGLRSALGPNGTQPPATAPAPDGGNAITHQLDGLAGGILQGLAAGAGTIARGPIGQGVADAYDVATGNWSGLTKPTGSPEELQAKAWGDAIQHSTDGLVPKALKDTVGAKVGGFVGNVLPYVAAGAADPAILLPALFSSGYQNQYESAKAKLTEAGQQTGQPVDPEHVETAAHTAGLLGGAINTVLGLPIGRAGGAIAKVFGGSQPAAITQGIVNAFENGGAKGVLDALGSIGEQGIGPEAQAAIRAAQAQINKTIGARVLGVAQTAAKDASIGAATQIGQNIVAQNLYDPNRSIFEGVPEQAVGFGLMGTFSGAVREGTSALEVAKGRAFSRPDAPPDSGGPTPSGNPLLGPTPHPADLAKPVQGKVVSPETTSPSPAPPVPAAQDALDLSRAGLPSKTPQDSSSQSAPGPRGSLASVPSAPGVSSSSSQTSGQPAQAPAAGQASTGQTDDDKNQAAAGPQVISSASFADVAGQPGEPSTQAALAQRTQALNAQMQSALKDGQRVDMVRVGGDGTETRQQISRAPDGRMVDESGNTVRAGAALTPDTRFEIAPPAAKTPPAPPVVQNPPAPSDQTSAASSPAADPAVAKMIQTRDDAQKLLDAGKVSPEAEETTRGLVDQLSRQISAAQAGQRPPAAPAQTSSPTPASPAGDSAASASNAPAPAGSAGPRPPAGSAEGSSSAVPAPRASGSSQSEAGASPSGEGSTPTAAHQALAEAANAGADTQAPGQAPTPTFAALKFLKKVGADVTPELARDVDAKVQSITTDPTLDVPGKTAALKKLVLDTAATPPASKAPTVPTADNAADTSTSSTAPAPQNGSGLQRTGSETGTAPEMKLPRELAGAKPRYAFGPKQFQLSFESDLDKAAYTLAQDGQNKRHADFLQAAQDQTGLSEQQLIAHGRAVRASIKALARDGDPQQGPLRVPKQTVNAKPDAKLDSYAKDAPVSARRGSTQLTLSPEDAKPFLNFARSLPDSIVHSEKDADGKEQYGREDEPHITSLYGLHGSGDDPAAVAGAVENHGPVKARVGKLSVFSNPDAPYDVLKAEIHSPALHGLNGRLRGLEHSSDFPDYKPHLTLAYLKKGAGAGLVGKNTFEGKELTFDHLTHSPADRTAGKTQIPLGKADENARQATRDAANRLALKAQADGLAAKQARGETLTPAEAKTLENARALLSGTHPDAQRDDGSAGTPQAPVPTERQPVTPEGKQAKNVVDALTARKAEQNGFLKPADQTSLTEARGTLDRDLNRQVLGANPQPTTEAGKTALKRIQSFDEARAAGAQLSPSEHAAWKSALGTLQSDFTAQRQAIEAKQAQPAGTATPAAPPTAPTPPAPAATFRKNEEVTFKGRRGTVEEITGDKALVRLKAGTSPTNPNINLVASRVRVPLAALEKLPPPGTAPEPGNTSVSPAPPPPPAKPIDPYRTADTARKLVAANSEMLRNLGVRDVKYDGTQAGSGIEIGGDGTLHLDIPKLAKSMATVRDNQASKGIEGTPEDWFAQVLAHEGIHAADAAVAKAKGQTLQQRYEALPAEAMPEGWQKAGRDVYGAKNWDALPEWKQKAEFVRQVVEGKWTGRLTEALYKLIKEAIDYLKGVAGFENADPRFKAHVEEVESRIEAARQPTTQPTYRAGGRATYGRRAATIQAIDGETATITLKGSKTPIQVPVAALKPPVVRRFVLPSTATGQPDVIDHIAENGGMRGSVAGKRIAAGKGIDVAGDYDDRPNLKGVYQNAVFGGDMPPDQMASLLHEDHGIGDGTVGEMYRHIDQAMQSRESAREEMQRQATVEKQATSFDKDALQTSTAKGATAIHARDLNVGETVRVGDQTLKVIDVDPDTLDVTLEDHSKYGVQTVADGQKLYVEKIAPGEPDGDNGTLAAARPDHETGDLFGGDDDPFNLQAELASPAERVAAAREAARRPSAPVDDRAAAPTLRSGEKGTGDLFQGEDQPFNLAGETAIDHGARQEAREQQERESAAALEKQYRDQGDLFNARPTEVGPRSMGQVPLPKRETFAPPTPPERLDLPAKEEKPATNITDIADFGEKIGGARKDTALPLGARAKADVPAENADLPGWQRKYVVSPETKRDYLTRADKPTGKFVVERTDGVRVRTPTFDTPEQARNAIPLIEAARNHGTSYSKKPDGSPDWHIFRKVGEHKRPVVKSGFASDADAKTYLATHPQEVIEHKFPFPERPWLDRLERTGGTPRTGNVTPGMFQNAFGFRGGEFGNWNKGGDGQAALNHAYDALHDFADALGVSPKALSLNGELAIAFGARGHGGAEAAAAHYEPGHQVINMTKIKGAGSLAHEWFHAFDHYLGRQDGKATDRTQAADARDASGRDPSYVRGEYASHGFSRQSGTREALRDAFKKVIDATVARPTEISIPSDKLADLHSHQAKYVQDTLADLRRQFSTLHTYSRTKKAAAPEQLAEFDRLAGQIGRGEVGERVNVPPPGGRMSFGRQSYRPIEDLNALYKQVLGRSFATNDEGSQGKRLYWQINAMKDAQKRVANAGDGGQETQTRNMATDFLKEARKIDNHRASDYWSLAHEMGARSFESYVADKLENSDRKNDYLVHGADNRLYAMFGLKPYPEGEERAGLNRAWQHVFDTIQEQPTDRGSALHAAEPEDAAADEPEPSAPLSARGQNAQRIADGITAREEAGHPINEGQQAHRAAMQRVVDEEQALSRQSAAAKPAPRQPGGEQTPDPKRAANIKELVDEATGPGAAPGRRYADYGTVSPEQAARLKSDTGLDLEGYHRNLDNMAVRHVLRNHGDPAAELLVATCHSARRISSACPTCWRTRTPASTRARTGLVRT